MAGATAAPEDPGGLGQGLEGEDGQGRYNLLEVSRRLVDHLSSITSLAVCPGWPRAPDKFKPFKPYLKTIQIFADNLG